MRVIKINAHEEVSDRNKTIIQINWRHGPVLSRADGPAIVAFLVYSSSWIYRHYKHATRYVGRYES